MIENINDFLSFGSMLVLISILLFFLFKGLMHGHKIRRYEQEVEYYSDFYEEEDDDEE